MLMSFIGCIGVLMRGTGLEDLLGCAFAGVPNMMNCKAWPNALRADRMVTSALLDEVHYRGITVVDLQAELEKARQLPTGRLWVDCLVIPVAIVHVFIRAERESDRLLHLHCVCTTNAPILLCRRTCKLCTLRRMASSGNARCSFCCSPSDVHERGPRPSTQVRSMELRLQRPV